MDYRADYDFLYEKVDEIVSQTAARLYGDDGTSIYDEVIIPSSEKPRITAFLDMGMTILLRRLPDVAWPDRDDRCLVHIDTPDMREENAASVRESITAWLVNYACSMWMEKVSKDNAQYFLDIAKGAIDLAAQGAKTRRRPQRPLPPPPPEDGGDDGDSGDDEP